jgi:lysozyme
MRTWIKEIQDTSAYQEGRIIGFALFTTDRPNDGTWKTFRTAQPELNLLADMVAEEWKPGQAPVQPVLAEGIDISRWQGTMNWSIANDKIDFAIYKATDGLSWVDPQFVANSENSAAAVKGPYHFFRPHTDGAGQATHFLNTINGHPFNVLVVDVEYGPIDHDELLAFMRAVREIYPSNRFLLYTSPGFYSAFLRGTDWSEYTELWIAHWGVQQPIVPEPYETWAMWQYTSLGDGAEYGAQSTYIDLNVFNGSKDDLVAWASDSPQPIRMIRAITNAKLRTKPYYTGQRGEDTYLLTVPEGHLMEWVGQEQGEEYQGSTVWNKINTWYRYNTSATGIVATTAYIHSELTEPA